MTWLWTLGPKMSQIPFNKGLLWGSAGFFFRSRNMTRSSCVGPVGYPTPQCVAALAEKKRRREMLVIFGIPKNLLLWYCRWKESWTTWAFSKKPTKSWRKRATKLQWWTSDFWTIKIYWTEPSKGAPPKIIWCNSVAYLSPPNPPNQRGDLGSRPWN